MRSRNGAPSRKGYSYVVNGQMTLRQATNEYAPPPLPHTPPIYTPPLRAPCLSGQVAGAMAAAKRGTGERGRLVESEAPVEEFTVRGRRVLVKRDDKVRSSK